MYGEPVAAGTEITAWVEAEQVGSAVTGEGELEPDKYVMTVELEGPTEVSFKIGEFWAEETATWEQYGAVEVNLHAYTGNRPPTVSEPSPADQATEVSTSPELSILASDLDEDLMTVAFYDASDDSVIGTVEEVTTDTSPSVTWAGLDYETQYSWYVKVSDGVNPEITSDTWNFTTMAVPATVELVAGVNIIPYTGVTTDLPGALTNIGPGAQDVVDVIWARGAWTGGEWLYYNARVPYGNLAQLETGRAYIIVVSQDCTWELP